MPEHDGDKTEAPTPRRREEARRKGQVAKSQDLAPAVQLLLILGTLSILGPSLWSELLRVTSVALGSNETNPASAILLAGTSATRLFIRVLPVMAMIVVAALIVLYLQVGWLMTTETLKPDLAKLNPIKGVARLFSLRNAMRSVMNLGKLAVVATIAYLVIRGHDSEIILALMADHVSVFGIAATLLLKLGLVLACALLTLALMDYFYQRYQHERDLRMTKQEVRDELRRMEGDPHIKRRRRDVHRQLAFQKLRKDVPKADVVVTNPTHVSVAIQYDAQNMSAPKVVAKGIDFMALRIREIAIASGVPIVERPSLSRMLHKHVEVGETIPERFYKAVAEILAYVYDISGRSAPARRSMLTPSGG